MTNYKISDSMVETSWLEEHLNDEALHIFDCTAYIVDSADPERRYDFISGLLDYEKQHIPGAGFIDVVADLSAPNVEGNKCVYNFPSAETVERGMQSMGVNKDSRVILYSNQRALYATRVWWILHAYGFNNAAVLNGTLGLWQAEGRPVSQEPYTCEPGDFVARPRSGHIATKEDVLEAIDSNSTVIVDSLRPDSYNGTSTRNYGRPGHIKSAVSVSAWDDLFDQSTNKFISADKAQQLFEDSGVTTDKSVITYCGSGIAGTVDAYILTLLGYNHVSLYDNSLAEWANDESLPMEI